ncbi:MAG TPA: carotenoid biosynthesis protein [Syntrophobacteraceae bacterium]|nr:carotenoid biosynthesis protein [Syntrophobacteraceae bacterium]
MSELPGLLWGTILLRPYVFAFLAVYIMAGCGHIGWRTTLTFIPAGYSLAWLSEFSSIHWGFPYGDYFYIQSTANRELWVFGVPLMDSLSYVFLSYCSYSLAVFMMSPVSFRSGHPVTPQTSRIRFSRRTLILGAFLFMLLDMVIDPVALQGERWFLGRIYGYRHEGFYFGVPMSNFGGWLFVGVVLILTLQALERVFAQDSRREPAANRSSWIGLLGPALYFSVLLFNIAVTFYIGETLLGLVDLTLFAALLALIYFFIFNKSSRVPDDEAHAQPSPPSSVSGNSALDPDLTRHLAQHRGWDPQESGD